MRKRLSIFGVAVVVAVVMSVPAALGVPPQADGVASCTGAGISVFAPLIGADLGADISTNAQTPHLQPLGQVLIKDDAQAHLAFVDCDFSKPPAP